LFRARSSSPVFVRASFAVALAAAAALVPAPLLAHAGAPPAPHDLWRSWSFAPTIVIPLFLTAWLYTRGVESLWRRAGRGRGIRAGQAVAFAAGVLALAVALVSPVDGVAESLFWVHMTQHLLLIAVAPPLLVLGAPQAGLAWGLPRPARRRVARWWHGLTRVRAAFAWLVRPWPAVALHSVALWAWHVPGAYDAAVASPWVHALEHTTFLATALLFWWAVLHPRGTLRRVPGLAILALFALTMEGGALGALLTFSTSPWYASHLATAGPWGLSPLDDQQIAGLVMWVPGSLPYLAAAAWLFMAWMARSQRRDAAADARRLSPRAHSA
jgi:cytochrome c oxidase assembly factor CtaG